MTHDEMVAVIQEHKRGKKIQAIAHEGPDRLLGWVDVFPNWDFYRCDFRVKPEPREWWVNVYSDISLNRVHESRTKADQLGTAHRIECIRVREVLEEGQ